MKITILAAHLKGLAGMAAKKDVRYYLNGVNVNLKAGRLEATDTYAIGFIENAFKAVPEASNSLIVPLGAIKAALTLNTVDVEIDTDAMTVGGVAFKPIDGKYPDTGRILVPFRDTNGERNERNESFQMFSPELLTRAYRFLGYSSKRNPPAVRTPGLSHVGIMLENENLTALIMPINVELNPTKD